MGIPRTSSRLAAATLFVLVFGCGNDDKGTNPDTSGAVQYETPSTPQSVLRNLVTAYTRRDIEGYADVLASNYKFTPTPNEAEPPSDVIDFPAEDGYVMVIVQNVNIDVLTREVVGGEPITLRVPGEPAKFVFQRTSETPPRFAISAIYDQAGAGRMGAPPSQRLAREPGRG
jgi:hypothetical protein